MGLFMGRMAYKQSTIKPSPITPVAAPRTILEDEQYTPPYHRLTGLLKAWEQGYRGKTKGGAAVPCFVIDTGGSPNHPDLEDAYGGWLRAHKGPAAGSSTRKLMSGGRDCTDKRGWCYRGRWHEKHWRDVDQHGTHVAGIIGARDNDLGIVGVAPECDLWAMRVFARYGAGLACLDEWLIRAIDEAIRISKSYYRSKGMFGGVMNMSLGSPYPLDLGLHEAMQRAVKAGFIIVAAAGNDGDSVDFPAAWPEAIAVGALSRAQYKEKLKPTPWSDHGKEIDAAAPGEGILSTTPDGWYAWFSGTSMAAPKITGEACRAKGKYPGPGYNTFAFREQLEKHSDPVSTDFLNETGWRLPRSAELAMVLNELRKDKEVRVISGRDVELIVA